MNLNHNSLEMKTVVETFIIEETASLIYDNEQLDKWNSLVSELGLTGQTTIVKPEKSPIPFMHLKRPLVNVFDCLCPRRVKVAEYNITPIPVEILDLIALSVREKYFDRIEIWYDDKSPDPACVGIFERLYTYNKNYNRLKENLTRSEAELEKSNNEEVYGISTHQIEYYLLGKWADVKHSFDELKQMATKRFTESRKSEIYNEIRKLNRELEDLDHSAFEQFN